VRPFKTLLSVIAIAPLPLLADTPQARAPLISVEQYKPTRWIEGDDDPFPAMVVALAKADFWRLGSRPGQHRLPAGTSPGKIDWTVLGLPSPENDEFRFRPGGPDTLSWAPGIGRQIAFSKSGSGSDQIQIIGSNNASLWSREGATLHNSGPPTIFRSIWVKMAGGLALLAIALLVHLLRVRVLTARWQAGFDARLAERERIARELSDTLLQGFQGLILRFQAISDRLPIDGPWREMMHRELDHADSVLIDGRDRVGAVRAMVAQCELAQSLMNFAASLAADPPLSFEIIVEGKPRTLHPVTHQEVQRLAEEAIRNAFHHSRGAVVKAVVSFRRRHFQLDIRDDGVGLPPGGGVAGVHVRHCGLPSMRERAKRIGGAIAIVSRDGAGTEVLLSIPGRAAYVPQCTRWSVRRFGGANLKVKDD
jgi:signal transduction histidine kinase